MIQQSVDLSLDSPIPLPLPAKKSRYLRNFAKGSVVQKNGNEVDSLVAWCEFVEKAIREYWLKP